MNYSLNLETGKKHLEAKGLSMSMGKTKINYLEKPAFIKGFGKHPSGVYCKSIGSNSIFCAGCQLWIEKKCSGIKGKLTADPSYKCKICTSLCRPIDGRPEKYVMVWDAV